MLRTRYPSRPESTRWLLPWIVIALFLRVAQGDDRPNILWLTCEDMSPRLGCYGDETVPTPNIDQLASQGVRYTHAFGVYGTCSPNRHALILGMYPNETGGMAQRVTRRTAALSQITDPQLLAIPVYEATPPAGVKCFSEYLRAAGYFCTNNVKTDYQFTPPDSAWDVNSDQAHWRERPREDMPFFSVFNFTGTHESRIFQQSSPSVVDPGAVELPPYYPDTPVVRRDVARHYDNIAQLDAWVGEKLRQLRQDKLDRKTIVFFFSDHGDGLPRMKRWVYDSGIRVPLIVRFPNRTDAGTVSAGLVSFVDFAPTMLSLCGVPIPQHMHGRAFLGQQQGDPRKYVFACRDRMDPAPETIRAVRDKRFKYVRNYRPDLPYLGYIPYRDQQQIMQEIHRLAEQQSLGPEHWQFTAAKKPLEELYDTQTDPHEIQNLAANPRYFEKLHELRRAHQQWNERIQDLGRMPESEMLKRIWPDGVQPTTATPSLELVDGIVSLACSTPGASLVWRLKGQPDPERASRWQLYTAPVSLAPGVKLEARAHRIGWKPSETVSAATSPDPNSDPVCFEKLQLTEEYYCDGITSADINGDGHIDVIAGPFWYQGPEFTESHAFYEPIPIPREPSPSNSMFSFVHDFSGDGRPDILVLGRVHKHAAMWYENPGESESLWQRHFAFERVRGESPTLVDLDGDGIPQVICHWDGRWGSIQPSDDARQPWQFKPLGEQQDWPQFYHGEGVGDVNGDGRLDLLINDGWYQQPSSAKGEWPFIAHRFSPLRGGAQMFAYDVDGDGDSDVISARHAHHWGLAWYEQRSQAGQTRFREHMIMGERRDEHMYGTAFSQPHAQTLTDINGDGLLDIVTGKRMWAHGPAGDIEPSAAPVVYWFQLNRTAKGQASYIPHLIDDESGVGVQVHAADVNADGSTDVLTASKLGAFVFLNLGSNARQKDGR